MSEIKPTNFPLKGGALNGNEEIYTQTGGTNNKFLVSQVVDKALSDADASDIDVLDTGANFTGETVEQVLVELLNFINNKGLADTLAIANISDGNNIIMSTGDLIQSNSGSVVIDLRQGADGTWTINSDNSTFAQSWIYGTTTFMEIGYANDWAEWGADYYINSIGNGDFFYIYANGYGIGTQSLIGTALSIISVVDNSAGNIATVSSSVAGVNINSGTGAGSSRSTFNSGVARSVAVGGRGLTIKTAETAYMNQASFQQDGVSFDTIVAPSTATADRTQTLKDASGTIAMTFVGDIIGDNATSTFVINHNLNNQYPTFTMWDVSGAPFTLSTAYSSVEVTSANSITVNFAAPVASGTDYKVSVTG